MKKEMLTVKEVRSEVLNGVVTEGTIYKMAREGQMPCVRIRGKILFHRSTIERWLANGGTEQRKVVGYG